MRALYLVILLVSMAFNQPSGTANPQPTPQPTPTPTPTPPFSVDCKTSMLTVKNATQIVYGTNGCKISKANGKFKLEPACLSQGTITLENVNLKDKVVTAVSTYNVTCDEGQVMTKYITVKISGPTGSPTVFTASPIPSMVESKVHLQLLSEEPSSTTLSTSASGNLVKTHLGDTLYMTLFSEDRFKVIPLICSANVNKSNNISAKLWQLHKSTSNGKDCFAETTVMNGVFSLKDESQNPYTVVKIEAFSFEDNQEAEIIFSCSVRVCSTTLGWCGQEKKALDDCSNSTKHRRRRDTINSEMSHGSVHHVTARLRIVNDVMTLGGATRATFTMTSLMLTAVAVMIL